MLDKLPAWVVDDVASVREEVREWEGTTESERWTLAKLCARDALWAIRASGNEDRILSHVDPLPSSTVEALARLREEAGWGRAGDA